MNGASFVGRCDEEETETEGYSVTRHRISPYGSGKPAGPESEEVKGVSLEIHPGLRFLKDWLCSYYQLLALFWFGFFFPPCYGAC